MADRPRSPARRRSPADRSSGGMPAGTGPGQRADRHELQQPRRVPAMPLSYTFTARLWLYPGEAGWHFLTVPDGVSAEIRDDTAALRQGFGSIKITAVIAGHRWSTSLFPDSHSGSYLLPVKKAIRTAAGIEAGDQVRVQLEVPDAG